MSPEAQQIAIAEACDRWKRNGVKVGVRIQPPDYLNDLNAMNEAEKVIIDRGNWAMCDYDQELSIMTSSWKWNATAAQRAEAFLKTLDLWKD